MLKNIVSLAFRGIFRKKRSSIRIFLVLLLSFAFAVASVSLVGSISKTNQEFRLNTFGQWYFAIPSGLEEDLNWLQNQAWVDAIGVGRSYGYIPTETGETGFGTVDNSLKEMGRLDLDKGRWPETETEIVLEADVLNILGYDYTIGQEVSFLVFVPYGAGAIPTRCTFTLCGIVQEYTDLWVLNSNQNGQRLNGAIVTEEGAKQVLSDAAARLTPETLEEGACLDEPIPQYFITVNQTHRESAQIELKNYLSQTRLTGDRFPCVNSIAYEGAATASYDGFYTLVIAAVALLAVLCIYIIQLPTEAKSFATLRAIGITRGQMGALLLTESFLLCLPALLLGVLCSFGITWLALRLLVYAGSVAIQVSIPWETVHTVVLLWVGVVALSRLLVYFITLRTPLTGRIKMQRKKAHRAKTFRSAIIFLLLSAFGFVVAFTSIEVLSPNDKRKSWNGYAAYTLWKEGTLPQSEVELIQKIPGISRTEGFAELQVYLSCPGLEEQEIYLYALDDTQWEDTFRFGKDREAFQKGERLLMLFPDATAVLPEEADRGYLVPEGDVTLRLYGEDGGCIMESKPVPTSARWVSGIANTRTIAHMHDPYTVICSEAYLQGLLRKMEPGAKWGKYTAGEPWGYSRVYAYVELTADDLSTDVAIAELCSRLDISLDNRRQQFTANAQQYTQEVLFLCGSAICVCLMILLILTGTISLETEQEKHSFTLLHCLGMSPWGRWMKIGGKAMARSFGAAAVGWVFYIGFKTAKELAQGKALAQAIPDLGKSLAYYGYGLRYIAVVFAVCVCISLLLTAVPKRKLKKEL